MNQDVGIYTETMAKVYADQGHWAKVVEIYRYLLAIKPDRLDFADALSEAENKMKMKAPEQLVPLIREWFELILKFEALQKLKKLKRGRYLSGLGKED